MLYYPEAVLKIKHSLWQNTDTKMRAVFPYSNYEASSLKKKKKAKVGRKNESIQILLAWTLENVQFTYPIEYSETIN